MSRASFQFGSLRSLSTMVFKPKTISADARAKAAKSGQMMMRRAESPQWETVFCVLKGNDLYVLASEQSDAVVEFIALDACQSDEWKTDGIAPGTACVLLSPVLGTYYFRCPSPQLMAEWRDLISAASGASVADGKITPPESIVNALRQMQAGVSLLKYGRKGEPHFQFFKVSPNGRQLTWDSKKKGHCVIELKDVSKIEFGQKTPNFTRKPMPEKESHSFSLILSNTSLDLICKDKAEYMTWTSGLQFLTQQIKKYNDGFVLNMPSAPEYSRTQEAVMADSDMVLWGRGDKGQVGTGDYKDHLSPAIPIGLSDISQVALGKDHCVAISKDTGEVCTWGCGGNGRLGHENDLTRNTPKTLTTRVLTSTRIAVVAAGDHHTLAVSENGNVFSWGLGYYGQLGHGDREDKKVPTLVEALSSEVIVHVACSSTASFAITRTGAVFYWGLLDTYRVDDCELEPILVDIEIGISHIAGGDFHVAAIASDGSLWTWGDGSLGQLGHGSTASSEVPKKVESALGIVDDVDCGAAHTAVICDGRLLIWGLLLRNGKQVSQLMPMREDIPDCQDDPVVSVSCAAMVTAITTESGKALMWGVFGRSFCDGLEESDTPHPLSIFSQKKVRSIVCGGNHIAAFVTREWMADDQTRFCMACKVEFSAFVRRHHCRKCLKIYCGSCSSKTYPLVEFGHAKTVRVCNSCYSSLSMSK